MTERFCGSCGAPLGAGTAFCASCGAPASPSPAIPYAPPPGAGYPQQHGSTAYGQPPPGAPYGVPYGVPAQGGAPWGSTAGSAAGTVGRGLVDALLGGDWRGAVRAAGLAALAMLALGLVGVLLLADGELGVREIVALTAGAACTAVGGDVFLETSGDLFGRGDQFDGSYAPYGNGDLFGGGAVSGSSSIGVLPLTLTLTGLALLAWLFVRSLRARGVGGGRDVLLQGARTALVFTGLFLPLALLTRYRIDQQDEEFGFAGQVGVSVWSTLIGALLFAVATLGLVWVFSRQTRSGLPQRLAAVRARAVTPLLGASAVFAAGLLGVLAFLVHSLVHYDERVAQLGVLVLGAGNGSLAAVLWSAGVPMGTDAGVAGTGLGEVTGGGPVDGVDLFTFTDASGWFWLAPVALFLVLLVVATVLTVRQNSVEDARREGFRFAGALAVTAFLAALLLRIAGEAAGGIGVLGGSADAGATFNPFLAAVALAVWGVVAGLLGPVLATRMSASLVARLRSRFGVAAPHPVAPVPAGPAVQGWQQPTTGHTQQFAPPPDGQQPYPLPEYGQPPSAAPEYSRPPVQQQPPQDPPPVPQQQPLPPVPPPTQ